VIRGIYTAATGMTVELNRQDVLANNLANVSTVGFKSDQTTTTPFQDILLNAYDRHGANPIGKLGLGAQNGPAYTDYSDGNIVMTDNPVDLALTGDAMFTVEVGDGIRYTRSGHFKQDVEGYLVTNEGYRVLGEKGPIKFNAGFAVLQTGEITLNGNVVDWLKLVGTDGLVKEGELLYSGATVKPATNFQVLQGSLEQSNVNAIREMIQMINITRSYDANQRALLAQDEALKRAANDLAK
jgi:flagellar basal-body rod protein FlgF